MKRLLLISLLFTASCSSSLRGQHEYLYTLNSGCSELSEQQSSYVLNKAMPSGDFRSSKDAAWLYLDRGFIRFSNGQSEDAAADFLKAIEAMDYYRQCDSLEEIGKIAIQDDIGGYGGSDSEQLLARLYCAFALYQSGDINNAKALLRQEIDVEERLQEYDRGSSWRQFAPDYCPPTLHLAKIFFSQLLIEEGDYGNAEALNPRQCSLGESIALVVFHNGRTPRKVTTVTPASQASTIALDAFLSCSINQPMSLSSFTGIPTPMLVEGGLCPLNAQIQVDGKTHDLICADHLGQKAIEELGKKLPVIVARSVARQALRRAAVGYAREQNPCLGDWTDLAMFILNVTTQADTRSWSTLPEKLDYALFSLPPGSHQMNLIWIDGYGRMQCKTLFFQNSKKGVHVIHLFQKGNEVDVLLPLNTPRR